MAHLTARELGITFQKLCITIEGNINPAKLFGHSDNERAGFKQIDVQFSPVTNATPDQIENWIETIKKRCPVNDNLSSPTPLIFNYVRKEEPVVI